MKGFRSATSWKRSSQPRRSSQTSRRAAAAEEVGERDVRFGTSGDAAQAVATFLVAGAAIEAAASATLGIPWLGLCLTVLGHARSGARVAQSERWPRAGCQSPSAWRMERIPLRLIKSRSSLGVTGKAMLSS